MKLLLVSYWFPPSNTIGAVRVGKLAKFLHARGHDVRVLCGPEVAPTTLPLEVPQDLLLRPPPDTANGVETPVPHPGFPRLLRRMLTARGEAAVRLHYRALRDIPDKRVVWLRPALAAGRALLQQWQPDLIVASGPPFTGAVLAHRLGRESGVPWIAELRDPWTDDPYNAAPRWRRHIDRFVERRTLSTAAALVCVSPPVARDLAARYDVPVRTVLNGFSPEDMVEPPARPPGDTLSIVYTGSIYVGFRDPSKLFAAIARLGPLRSRVEVRFYGPTAAQIMPLAARHGVADRVQVCGNVGYRESLALQAAADVLLLLQRDHPSDDGNIPAKFFEYLGARRPILLLGYARGVIADMIRTRGAGFIAQDTDDLAAQLRQWIGQLPAGIPPLPEAARDGLSRTEQFGAYEAFLAELACPVRPVREPAPMTTRTALAVPDGWPAAAARPR